MAAALSLDSLQAMALLVRESYLGHVLLLVLVISLLKLVVATWRSGLASYETQLLPPVNPNVLYPYGVAQIQGRRPYMEDRHTAQADLNGAEKA